MDHCHIGYNTKLTTLKWTAQLKKFKWKCGSLTSLVIKLCANDQLHVSNASLVHTSKTCVMNLPISRISRNPCFLYSIILKRSVSIGCFCLKTQTPQQTNQTKPNLTSFLINCYCGHPQHMYLITLVLGGLLSFTLSETPFNYSTYTPSPLQVELIQTWLSCSRNYDIHWYICI